MTPSSFDVVIVGAGAAGVGCGVVLRDLVAKMDTVGMTHLTYLPPKAGG
jgi:thioredoxin reductase